MTFQSEKLNFVMALMKVAEGSLYARFLKIGRTIANLADPMTSEAITFPRQFSIVRWTDKSGLSLVRRPPPFTRAKQLC